MSTYSGKRRALAEMYAFRIEAARQAGTSPAVIAAIRQEQRDHLKALKRHDRDDAIEHKDSVKKQFRDMAEMMHSFDQKPNRDLPMAKYITYELKTG